MVVKRDDCALNRTHDDNKSRMTISVVSGIIGSNNNPAGNSRCQIGVEIRKGVEICKIIFDIKILI